MNCANLQIPAVAFDQEQLRRLQEQLPCADERLQEIQKKKEEIDKQELLLRKERQALIWKCLQDSRETLRMSLLHCSPDWTHWRGFLANCDLGDLDSSILHRFLTKWELFSIWSEQAVFWLSDGSQQATFQEMKKEYDAIAAMTTQDPCLHSSWSYYMSTNSELTIMVIFFKKADNTEKTAASTFCTQLHHLLYPLHYIPLVK